jgi:hypothetical protein
VVNGHGSSDRSQPNPRYGLYCTVGASAASDDIAPAEGMALTAVSPEAGPSEPQDQQTDQGNLRVEAIGQKPSSTDAGGAVEATAT